MCAFQEVLPAAKQQRFLVLVGKSIRLFIHYFLAEIMTHLLPVKYFIDRELLMTLSIPSFCKYFTHVVSNRILSVHNYPAILDNNNLWLHSYNVYIF